ncbi:MAG: sialidase family protein [Chitinophagaceae bacterium]
MNVVFRSGDNGYHTYRIPAIIKDPKGILMAFCEGRKKGSGDFGNIDIVMRKSNDDGVTWSDLKVIVDAGELQAGNPAPVVDMLDPRFPSGRIFLFYNTGNNHENEIRKGNGIREVWYKTSIDGGETWSEPVNITLQVHFPFLKISDSVQQGNNSHQISKWRSYANTPGHGIQLMKKPYEGRIYIAANHSEGEPQKDFSDYQAHGFYSDDHGTSFRVSSSVSILGSNESTAVELIDGRLMMNSRNQRGDVKNRIVSISSNGGETWDTSYFDQQLPDPVNEGSILQLGLQKKRQALAFCNAANETKRDTLTLRISYDDGRSWSEKILIDQNNIQDYNDFTAYSDLVQLNQRVVGILYERDNYKEIVFKKQKWH